MSVDPGTRLGPYEITAKIGEGGMGEVYRARDTRLDRDVAIKVLPAHVAGDNDARARFEREARAISQLSHPHICALYDVGREGDTEFLVLEYLDGETLAERLQAGPLPLDDAMRLAIQIADALDKAHRQGIVHRDLKPGNVMLTRTGSSRSSAQQAKLLDFGLAKAAGTGPTVPTDLTSAPTRTTPLTAQGTILGTFQYMAPEQIEGAEADARSDIWAFGCVLSEMVTARRTFTGKTHAGLIGSILKDDPAPVSVVQPQAPPALDRIIRTCLAKDPDDRFQTAHDLLLQLRWTAEGGSTTEGAAPGPAGRTGRERVAWGLAAAAVLVAGAAWMWAAMGTAGSPLGSQPISFSLAPPEGFSLSNTPPAISPDGTQIAFVVSGADRVDQLWVRRLGDVAPRPLDGTTGASAPFWSPDGRYIGYFSGSTLWTVDITGAPPRRIADLAAGVGRGGTWNEAGDIVFGVARGFTSSGLYRVPAVGGVAVEVTSADPEAQRGHRWPQFLPGGRRFIFLRAAGGDSELVMASLDDPTPRSLTEAEGGRYVDPGYLLFVRDGTLLGQAFDAGTAQLTGEPFVVQNDIAGDALARSVHFDVARGGVLVFRTGAGDSRGTALMWFDRDGQQTEVGLPAGVYEVPVLSRAGDRLAVHRTKEDGSGSDIWVFDLDQRLSTRLTTSEEGGSVPVWSPEGDRLVFGSTEGGGGPRDLFSISSTSPNTGELLFTNPSYKTPTDWSRDGAFVLFQDTGDVYALPVAGDRVPVPVAATPDAGESGGHFSPDGHWVAYHSDTSGANRIYVSPFPPTGQVIPVSAGEGTWPLWRDDGREIYYLGPDDQIMAVPIRYENGVPRAGAAQMLFDTEIAGPRPRRNYYAATGDGQRFLIPRPVDNEPVRRQPPFTVIVNWLEQVGR